MRRCVQTFGLYCICVFVSVFLCERQSNLCWLPTMHWYPARFTVPHACKYAVPFLPYIACMVSMDTGDVSVSQLSAELCSLSAV